MAKLAKNETVSLDVLVKICKVLHCDIGDLLMRGSFINTYTF
jgi:DNA-binding Xre family transcriptional regulator